MIISELRQKSPLKDLVKLLELPRSTFYYYLKHQNTDKYEREKNAIIEIFNTYKDRYGYHIILMIMHSKGFIINYKTVQKLMKTLGLKGKQRKNEIITNTKAR